LDFSYATFVIMIELCETHYVQVSDKRAAWLKLRGLAAGNRWEDLLAFANEKKSPIGYEPFVEVCMSRSNFSAAESYCEKVTDHSRRSQLYLGKL
jgi:hypothetical protein